MHHFLRCTALLDGVASVSDFHSRIPRSDDLVNLCRSFLNTLGGRSASCIRAYTRVFNLLFHDIWPTFAEPFRHSRNARRVRTLAEIDSVLSSVNHGGPQAAADYFATEEVDRLTKAAAASGPREHVVWQLLLTTGLRRTALINVQIRDVASAAPKGPWQALTTGRTLSKGLKIHTFPIHASAAMAVERWLNTPEEHGGRPESASPFLFPSALTDNGQMSRTTLTNCFRTICDKAGIPRDDRRRHLHAIRHTHAHILADQKNSPEVIASALGHASSSTTTRVYLRETPDQARGKLRTPASWLEDRRERNQTWYGEKKEATT